MSSCASSDILTGGGGGGGGVVSPSCRDSPLFGPAVCIETGQMRFPVCPAVLADALAITPSVNDKSETVKGRKGNRFSVWNQGLVVELREDVTTPQRVESLISADKARVVSSFIGKTD